MKPLFQFLNGLPTKHRDIFILIVAYAFFAIGGSLFWAAIPILSTDVFQLGTFSASLLLALIGVVYILTDGPTGVILDYIGYKKGAAISVLFAGITGVISLLEPSLPMFVVSIVFFALAWNSLTLAANAYILYNSPKDVAGRAFGSYGSFYSLGVFIATLFTGYVSGWGFEGVGWFFLVPTAITFLLILFLKSEKRNYENNLRQAMANYWNGASQWKRGWNAMKEFSPISWVRAFDGFTGYTFNSAIWLVIPLALASFANPYLPEGFALGAFEIAGIFAILAGGVLADRYSKKRLFLGFLFFQIVATLALGFATGNFFLFIFLAFVTTVLLGAADPALDSLLAIVDKKHDKDGTIYGFIAILTDLGFVVGPIIGGLVYDSFSLKGVFIFLSGLLFINWVVAKILLRNFDDTKGEPLPRSPDFYLGGMVK